MILEKLHRAIRDFNKAFNWRQFRRDALHLGESLLVFGVMYGIFFGSNLGRLLADQNQLRPQSHCCCMGGAGAAGHPGQQGLRLEQ